MNIPKRKPHRRPDLDTTIETANLPEKAVETVACYQKKIARLLFEISCLSGLSGWTIHKTLPSQFIKHLQRAFDLYDEAVHFLTAQLRHQSFAIRCAPGCIHCCCHMPSGVSTPELIFLYYGAHRTGSFPRFFRRCLEAEQKWREVLVKCSRLPFCGNASGDGQEAALESYHQLEHYCPFLQNNLCQVYPYRPIACRMHFSLSPPHWCNPSHFQNSHAVRFSLEPGKKVFEALEKIERRLQLKVSDVMVSGLLELSVNVLKCEEIRWLNLDSRFAHE
jgi:Fe-S-cluster containining protein